jgi:hypothetical protein
MGVPIFFSHILKKYKKSNFVFKEKVEDIDWFLIDTNCLIHPICFQVLADHQDNDNINFKSLENKMMIAVIEYIEKLIQHVDPKVGVYIAIDGPVPAAKMKQQRQRRFRSVHDKVIFDKLKKKYNKEIGYYWNNSSISPGTKFMNKLHQRILDWCNKNKSLKIIYSSANSAGEGEHKLLTFIKENNKQKIFYKYVTYGLDADLIFLMLLTKLDDVYLLREAHHFDSKEKNQDELNYVSIKIMKDCIFDSFNSELDENISLNQKVLNKDRIIADFIFLCYFLGNDFLPHLHALDISKNGIEYLIKIYIETYVNQFDYMLCGLHVNQEFLKMFIEKLAEQEDDILVKNHANKKKYFCNDPEPYEKEKFKIEHLLFKVNDPIGIGVNSDYRKNYYKHNYGVSDDELEEFVEKLVKNYLIGVQWVTNYYFDDVCSWNWYFQYDYPPFISDISKYLITMTDITFKLGKPVAPLEQLLIILPPQSSYLLPKPFVKITTNTNCTLAYLYPQDFHVDFLYKKKYFEGIPLLPPFELDLVKHIYLKYKDELSEEEQKLNIISDNYFFN